MDYDTCKLVLDLALGEVFAGITATEALCVGGAGALTGAVAALLLAWLFRRPRQLPLFK